MTANRLVGRLFYFLPLVGAVLLVPVAPDRAIGPALSFVALSVYARMAAVAGRLSGKEEALLFAEALPFFAYAAAFLSGLGPAAALLASLEAAAIWAALLWLEGLLAGERSGFALALAFMAAATAGGFGMGSAPALAILGPAALLLAACSYVQARRSRA